MSYWGYRPDGRALIRIALDTLDPLAVSMSGLRALVLRAAELRERHRT
jgi:hypothetical protein